MTRKPVNLPASVATRLRNLAAVRKTDMAFAFRRYAIERLLYRLSVSDHKDNFVLKGAMLFTAWMPDPFRPTQDLDLLGFGNAAVTSVAKTITAVCKTDVPDDGLTFDTKTLKAEAIRTTQDYGGVRVKLTALLGKTSIPVQIDIGFGDAVTPAITHLEFPPLLDAPPPSPVAARRCRRRHRSDSRTRSQTIRRRSRCGRRSSAASRCCSIPAI